MNTNTVRSTVIAASTLVSNGADELIPGTDWTWADAASMSKEIRREDRLFGNRRPTARRVMTAAARLKANAARKLARFTAQTGWSMADAMDEAIEARRDQRLYGNGHYAAV